MATAVAEVQVPARYERNELLPVYVNKRLHKHLSVLAALDGVPLRRMTDEILQEYADSRPIPQHMLDQDKALRPRKRIKIGK